MQWITKDNKSESIRKYTDNKPLYGVSLDQLWSSQPGLVPQFSGKLTSSQICSAQVMVNHFSDLTYLHLMRITSQEENLAVKSAFERWANTFGVKIKIYHAENGRFSKQAFRSEIEDTNQNINFCGVGSHHQNTIVEIKILTLTLGPRKIASAYKNILTRGNN